jgi:hypothetical protein
VSVTNRTKSGFDVRARSAAASSASSDRIVAKRKGYESERFLRVTVPEALPPLGDDGASEAAGSQLPRA